MTVVAVRRAGGAVENATAETVIREGDTVVLLGRTQSIARLAAR